jgi:acyl-CoA synthetase (AMP-forming)/AMP-acid ligase II
MTMTVAELYDRAIAQGGDRIAVSDARTQLSYRDLGAQGRQLAAALHGLGVGRGSRVAFLMSNCAEYVPCEYAVAWLGATRVPLAALLGADDHVYMLGFARCEVLIYHSRLAERVQAIAPRLTGVRHFICVAGEAASLPAGHLDLATLMAASAAAPERAGVDPEDIAGIYFTGGTTGRPKGVMLSHRSWFHTYQMEMLDFDIGWHETFLFTTPMTHAAGCLLLPVLLRQGRCVILERFDPELLLATVAAERVTATLLVPTMIYALLDHPRRDAHDRASLRNILYGAAPIAPERLRAALAAFGEVFTQFFGQTEAPMALLALPRPAHRAGDPARQAAVLATAGRPTYATELRLVDEGGRDVAPGQPGEIIIRAPNMMSGYLDDPEATAAAIRDGWLHTGDVAWMDAEGLVTIVDRRKDMIISGGFNVYPREIEDVLFQHPAVQQAAVVGVPHPRWGEQVLALVVTRPGARVGEDELIDWVRARKGSIMAPKAVAFVADIPVTNLGKIDKKAIRARYWAGQDRQV